MPNWCSNEIRIYSDNDKLSNLENLIKEWTSKNAMDNGFGTTWLGNIVLNSGIGNVDLEKTISLKENTFRCRGDLVCVRHDKDEQCLYITTETAWCPMIQMWIAIMEKYCTDGSLFYSAEECGMGLYETNDMDMVDCYYIDPFDGDEEVYCASFDEAIDWLRDKLERNEGDENYDNIECLIKEYEDLELGAINQWEYYPLCDVD